MYEIKGGNAKVELNILMELLEEIENGESNDGKSAYVSWVSGGGWMQKVNNSKNNLGNLGRGQNNQNAGVLQSQSKRNGSPAFWCVLENLFDIQSRRGINDRKNSIKMDEDIHSIKRVGDELSQEYNDISEFIPRKMITKSNIYKFLSDKESWSEANQLAIRWANKAAVEAGAQTVISYHGQWYVVEKFDSADMKYQIVGKIRSRNYDIVLNEVKKSEESREVQTVQRSFDRLAALYKEGDKIERGRHSSGDITTRRDGENNTIQRVGREQDDERKVYSDTRRGNERNGSDRENSSVKNSDRKNSVKMDEDILRKHENLKKAYARMAADFSRLKRENREFRKGKIATVAKKLLTDFDFAYDSDLLAEKMSGLSEDTKQMIAGNILKTTHKLIVGCLCDS